MMPTAWKWKVILLLGLVILSTYLLVPTFFGFSKTLEMAESNEAPLPWYFGVFPEKGINLGLDLRGGIYMEFEVETGKAIANKVDSIVDDLERGFKKSRKIVLFISLLSFILVFSLASPIINIIYGGSYAPAINLFRILSLLILSFPLSSLYQTYYLSQTKSKIVVISLIFSTILNIVLTYILITALAPKGGYYSSYRCRTCFSNKSLYLFSTSYYL